MTSALGAIPSGSDTTLPVFHKFADDIFGFFAVKVADDHNGQGFMEHKCAAVDNDLLTCQLN